MLNLRARSKTKELISNESGTVGLDYGMIVSFLAVALITGLSPIGNNLGTSFRTAADAILAAPAPIKPPPAAAPPTAARGSLAPAGRTPRL